MISTRDTWNWEKANDICEYWLRPDGLVVNFGQDLKKNNKKTVYDLGCGLGRHIFYLADLGLDVSGSDSSSYAVDYTNKVLESKNIPNRVSCINMNNIQEINNEYDAVIAFHSIYHNTYEGMLNVIDKIWRMLKPDGKVFLTFLIDPKLTGTNLGKSEFVKDHEPEKNVPHVALNKEYVPGILRQFNINQLWYVEHSYKSLKETGYHCFIEATVNKNEVI